MRWLSYRDERGDERCGRLIGDAVHVLPSGETVLSLLGDDGERLWRAGERAEREPDLVVAREGVRLLPPIPRPPSFRDFYAFEQHAKVGRRTLPPEWYEIPVFYFGHPDRLVGDGHPVSAPPGSARLDFELEVAVVVGLPGADIAPERAGRHIIGYSILNDWSARDFQQREMRVGLGPAKGKDFATGMGPCLVTPDELEPFRLGMAFDLSMKAFVNDRQYTSSNLSSLSWSFEEMVSFASWGASVAVGDVIGSGTCPTGCIAELAEAHGPDAYPWLSAGDHVRVAVEKLGELATDILPACGAGWARRPVR